MRHEPIKDTCESCKYGILDNGQITIICHRNPPIITKVDGDAITTFFPPVSKDNWCGEYKRQTRK